MHKPTFVSIVFFLLAFCAWAGTANPGWWVPGCYVAIWVCIGLSEVFELRHLPLERRTSWQIASAATKVIWLSLLLSIVHPSRPSSPWYPAIFVALAVHALTLFKLSWRGKQVQQALAH